MKAKAYEKPNTQTEKSVDVDWHSIMGAVRLSGVPPILAYVQCLPHFLVVTPQPTLVQMCQSVAAEWRC